jgi:hypothetical protein
VTIRQEADHRATSGWRGRYGDSELLEVCQLSPAGNPLQVSLPTCQLLAVGAMTFRAFLPSQT